MHLDSEGTRTLEALKTLRVLRHSRHLGTWETRALEGHSGTQGTRELRLSVNSKDRVPKVPCSIPTTSHAQR